MDKEIVAYPYNRMFSNKENKPTTAMCKNMDESHKWDVEQRSQLQKSRCCILPFTDIKIGKT